MRHNVRKQISGYLREKLEEQEKTSGKPFNWLLCEELVRIATDGKTSVKDKLAAIGLIMDRVEGKAVQTNVNAEVGPSPLADIPTETLEALRKKAEELGKP